MPIKLAPSGFGSEEPITLCQMFYDCASAYKHNKCMFQQKEGQEISYTWGEYFDYAKNFAKAITKAGVRERAAVAIMGFNAPEWIFSFMGGILNN